MVLRCVLTGAWYEGIMIIVTITAPARSDWLRGLSLATDGAIEWTQMLGGDARGSRAKPNGAEYPYRGVEDSSRLAASGRRASVSLIQRSSTPSCVLARPRCCSWVPLTASAPLGTHRQLTPVPARDASLPSFIGQIHQGPWTVGPLWAGYFQFASIYSRHSPICDLPRRSQSFSPILAVCADRFTT